MGTKQNRLSHPSQVLERINELKGKEINIVLHNGKVFLGKLKSCAHSDLIIINMRQKEMSFLFDEINELYFDTLAAC